MSPVSPGTVSASGQLAMRHVLEAHLKRVEWDERQFPVRLYPFVSVEPATPERPIGGPRSAQLGAWRSARSQ